MGIIKYSIYKLHLSNCKTLEQINEVLDKAIENKEAFSPMEKLLLSAYAIQKLKKIAGVK